MRWARAVGSCGVVLGVLALLAGHGLAAGGTTGASEARTALALCSDADEAPASEKRLLLERGLATAERAVADAETNADAHFAVFCNLGKLMRLDGASLVNLIRLRRLRAAVDRTLELAPTYPDALVGKAALLYYTPRLLGGDRVEGERLLRTALVVAPDFVEARIALAHLLADRGDVDEARSAARQALDVAARVPVSADKQDEARQILRRLGN